MKKVLFLISFITCIFCVKAGNDTATSNPIDIKGSTGTNPKGPSRVPSPYPAVEAFLTDLGVIIQFNRDFGAVDITVRSAITGEMVYQNTLSSTYQTTEIIDTIDFPIGSYVITISNNNGMSLQGQFEL